MGQRAMPGQIVILNGAPRSGKSSIAAVIQNTFAGVWMNLGVDWFKSMTPERYQPGIGLRPGGERPDLEPLIVLLYRAMYQAIAHHSRLEQLSLGLSRQGVSGMGEPRKRVSGGDRVKRRTDRFP